jgi:hypothetical protein
MTAPFPACHGIGVEPADIGLELGWLDEKPPRRVRVEVVDAVERSPDAELMWQLEEPADLGLPAITSQTWREPQGSTWVGNTLNLTMRLDHRREVVTVAPSGGNRQVLLEALASIGLPMVAQEQGSLVLHASAASRGESAVLLCAEGGRGKSSLLIGLVGAGWQAVSEDQCVIEVDERGRHIVWPGPNWVRLKQGAPAPPAPVDGRRFEALDKVGWDLDAWMAHRPARLDRIVFLEPPGGDEPVCEPISQETAIAKLAEHATWLQKQEAFAESVLPQAVNLALHVPAVRVRIPRHTDWLTEGVALLTAAA